VIKPETLALTVFGKETGSARFKGAMAFERKDYGRNKGVPFRKIATVPRLLSTSRGSESAGLVSL